MSVLIKGMEMPKNGEMKKIIIGRAPNGIEPIAIVTGDKTEFYKIFEVPTPHGRLIDADRFLGWLEEFHPNDVAIMSGVKNARTVIEAEVSEE